MLSEELKRIYSFRVQMVLDNLRNCNSAGEIHEVGNMRNVAVGIQCMIDDNDASEETVVPMLKRLENQQVEFFKKKYGAPHLYLHERKYLKDEF